MQLYEVTAEMTGQWRRRSEMIVEVNSARCFSMDGETLTFQEALEQVLTLLLEVLRFRRPFQESLDGLLGFLLHLLLNFAGQPFHIDAIRRILNGPSDQERKFEPPILGRQLTDRRGAGDLLT